jgi:pantoate--beta-alanine ligase
MNVVRTSSELREALAAHRGARIGFVPTMGALHDGHARLFQAARAECAHRVASIFVNPLQFNDPSDLAKYPRQEEADVAVAAAAGIDTMFVPSVGEIYPPGHATTVNVAGAATGFEAEHRPGHFEGVATVCLILFEIVRADVAYFGQKDAQQVGVIKQLVRDFHVPLEIRVVPTVRDPDGLAMSSRNARLSTAERRRALAIPRALDAALSAHARGEDPAAAARDQLTGVDPEYVDVAAFDGRPTLVIAARVGNTRLIDNVPLDQPELAGLSAGGSHR